jgi:putative endonuclease
MEKGFIYVLRCNDLRFYIGSTRDLNKRIEAHRQGRVKTTKGRRPVQLIYTEEFETYSDARRREIFLKTGTGRDWIKMKLGGPKSGCSL